MVTFLYEEMHDVASENVLVQLCGLPDLFRLAKVSPTPLTAIHAWYQGGA